MNEIEDLESRIIKLLPEDFAKFRSWFLEFDHRLWDDQISADFKAGKLDSLIDKAREELKHGKAREL